MESVPAENLHAFIHHKVQHLAAVHFRNRALDRVFLQHLHRVRCLIAARRAHRRFDVPRRAVHHRLHRKNLYRHLRQLFLHQPEIADLLAKRFPLLRILRRCRQHIL